MIDIILKKFNLNNSINSPADKSNQNKQDFDQFLLEQDKWDRARYVKLSLTKMEIPPNEDANASFSIPFYVQFDTHLYKLLITSGNMKLVEQLDKMKLKEFKFLNEKYF